MSQIRGTLVVILKVLELLLEALVATNAVNAPKAQAFASDLRQHRQTHTQALVNGD